MVILQSRKWRLIFNKFTLPGIRGYFTAGRVNGTLQLGFQPDPTEIHGTSMRRRARYLRACYVQLYRGNSLLLKFRFPQFKLTFRAAKSKALELVVFSFLDRLKRILNNITIIFEISPIEKMRSLGLS